MPALGANPARAEVYLTCMRGEPNASAVKRQPVGMGGGRSTSRWRERRVPLNFLRKTAAQTTRGFRTVTSRSP
jgi:hypothetical protein